MSDFLLALQDVHVNFPARKNWLGKVTERVHALNGLDLQIRQGETLGIVGESGCGKSTLAQLLMGMLKPSQEAILAVVINSITVCKWSFRTLFHRWILAYRCGARSLSRYGSKNEVRNVSAACLLKIWPNR
jgi:ABC-type glutathione transport system ATPase component